MTAKIKNSDIEQQFMIKINERITLLYLLKDKRYVYDNELLNKKNYKDNMMRPNWGSSLSDVKFISDKEAKELIAEQIKELFSK